MAETFNPTITTIIPTYRRPILLRRAINSVLNQTYPHFQVCVYDNASGDETADVVAEFANRDPRVKYYCHPENIGGGKNFNYGMQHVNTEFFSFLSDDDILLPEFYQTAIEGFSQHPEAIFSSALTLMMTEQGVIWDSFSSNWRPGYYSAPEGLLAMVENGHPTWTGIIFRRDIIEKVGILDLELSLNDLDLEFRAAAHFPFVISLHPGAIFVANPEGGYSNIGFQDSLTGWLKMVRKLSEDSGIQVEIRNKVTAILQNRIERMVFSFGFKSVLQRAEQDTRKILDALKDHYPRSKRIFALMALDKICKYVPLSCSLFIGLNNFRRHVAVLRRQKGARDLYKRYRTIFEKVRGESA